MSSAFEQALSAYEAGDLLKAKQLCEPLETSPAKYVLAMVAKAEKRWTEAENLLLQAIALEPQSDYFRQLGHLYRHQNKASLALDAYHKALHAAPEALSNHANYIHLLMSLQAFYEAQNQLQTTLTQFGDWVQGQFYLAYIFFKRLQFSKALHILEPVKQEKHLGIQRLLVQLYQELKWSSQAQEALKNALNVWPDDPGLLEEALRWGTESQQETARHALLELSDLGQPEAQLALARVAFDGGDYRQAESLLRPGSSPSDPYLSALVALALGQSEKAHQLLVASFHPPFQEHITPQKQSHDRAQLDHLAPQLPPQAFQSLAHWLQAPQGPHPLRHTPFYNPTNSQCIQVLTPLNAETVTQTFRSKGVVVLDDLLLPDALDLLYSYILNTLIWRDYYPGKQYLGAFLDDGLHAQVLLKLACELREALPELFDKAPLKYMWAFKYFSQSEGISVHADNALINMNFWITPDAANLDPETGGLLLYPQKSHPHWDFNQYNSESTSRYLDPRHQGAQRVSYRQNRAVIFDSQLLHCTDHFDFRPEYLYHRVNITLLFGAQDGRKKQPSSTL